MLSDDPPTLGAAIVLELRRVLERARDFEAAVTALERVPLVSDCLLVVTGVAQGEMAVIERTPTRSAIRGPEGGRLVATNDYRALAASAVAPGALAATSCGRFDRATALLSAALPRDARTCFEILLDPGVKMGITAQSMVLSARRGTIELAP